MVLGLGTPLLKVHAWSPFDLFGWANKGTNLVPDRVVAQNSQTIAFLESPVNLEPRKALGGGDITIINNSALLPEEGPSGTIADIKSNDYPGGVTLYVVRSGDTVAQLAKMFEISVNTILWANDLSSGATLRGGQTLVILPVDGVQHTIKKGETLSGIARKYGASVTDIFEFNDLAPGQTLSVGDTVIIPGGKEGLSSHFTTSSSVSPKSSLSSVRNRLISSYPAYSGYYKNPLPTGHKTQGVHGYNGVDIGAPIGDTVYSAAEGIVIVSKFKTLSDPWFGGYGNYVIIEHPNGTQTLYAHMSAVYVAVGVHVDQGQPIGEVGNTGHSTGPHLHFEVRGAKNPF